jgi:hypothetical protein
MVRRERGHSSKIPCPDRFYQPDEALSLEISNSATAWLGQLPTMAGNKFPRSSELLIHVRSCVVTTASLSLPSLSSFRQHPATDSELTLICVANTIKGTAQLADLEICGDRRYRRCGLPCGFVRSETSGPGALTADGRGDTSLTHNASCKWLFEVDIPE